MNNTTESLETLQERLRTATGKDRVGVLNSLSSYYWHRSPDTGVRYGELALQLARGIHDQAGIAKAYNNIGVNYWGSGDYHKALQYHQQSLEISRKIADNAGIASSLTNIGVVHHKLADYQLALEYYKQALRLEEGNKDLEGITGCLINIGLIFFAQGDYEQALEYYMRSLKIAEDNQIKNKVVPALINISNLYLEMGDYDKVLEYNQRALAFARKGKNKKQEAVLLHNIGNVYSRMSNHEKALAYYKESLRIKEALGDLVGAASSLLNIGNIHHKLDTHNTSLAYHARALEVYEKLQNKQGIAYALYNMSDCYKDLDDFDNAYDTLNKALAISQKINTKRLTSSCYNLLSRLHAAAGDYKAAYESHVLHAQVKEEIFSEDKTKQIVEMEAKYETEKAKKNARFQQQRNAEIMEKNALIIEQKNKLEALNADLHAANFALEKALATKNKFFSIIAHDLRNPIQIFLNIATILSTDFHNLTEEKLNYYTHHMRKTCEYFMDLLENLLEWARMQTGNIPFNRTAVNLNDAVAQTINLLKSNCKEKNISLHTDIQLKTIYADKNMLLTVLRNLLSNAIKFTPPGGAVHIQATDRKTCGLVSIHDTGIGISREKASKLFLVGEKDVSTPGTAGEKGTGLGLILCKEFIDKHGGKIWVEGNQDRGSVFLFTLPKKEDLGQQKARMDTPGASAQDRGEIIS